MGVLGGLFGALFNQFNTILTKYRMNHIAKKKANRLLRYVKFGGRRKECELDLFKAL